MKQPDYFDYLWLAKQRPKNWRQNRILLKNATRRRKALLLEQGAR
ncbi:hypothetical protein [Paenibacillus oleatilyticus]|uniref:Uncharacterized protein n=1 Tax=Paenibacillus oleatilyticus TaxID=2594886 RepID=A0ABV4VCB1_9BACL